MKHERAVQTDAFEGTAGAPGRAAAGAAFHISRVLFWAVRYFNPVATFVLGTRLHGPMSGRLMLLTFTGRRSRRSITTPVSYFREQATLLIPQAAPGGGASTAARRYRYACAESGVRRLPS